MLKRLVPKFRPHLSASLNNTAEKQVPAKLKPIVGVLQKWIVGTYKYTCARVHPPFRISGMAGGIALMFGVWLRTTS